MRRSPNNGQKKPLPSPTEDKDTKRVLLERLLLYLEIRSFVNSTFINCQKVCNKVRRDGNDPVKAERGFYSTIAKELPGERCRDQTKAAFVPIRQTIGL